MLHRLKDSVSSFAETVVARATALARRVGPKRGIVALGVVAVAVGASVVVRYFKQRGAEPDIENPSGGARTKKQRRRARPHEDAAHLH
jgi:hypothetical protein